MIANPTGVKGVHPFYVLAHIIWNNKCHSISLDKKRCNLEETYMKISLVHVLLFFSFCKLAGQQVVVDSTLVVETTQIKTIDYSTFGEKDLVLKGPIFEVVSKASYEGDTLKLKFYENGLAGKALVVSISETVTAGIKLWSDYPAFDGKYSKYLELELSEITINQKTFKNGDTVMMKLKCRSVAFDGYAGNPKFEYVGTIRHVIALE